MLKTSLRDFFKINSIHIQRVYWMKILFKVSCHAIKREKNHYNSVHYKFFLELF